MAKMSRTRKTTTETTTMDQQENEVKEVEQMIQPETTETQIEQGQETSVDDVKGEDSPEVGAYPTSVNDVIEDSTPAPTVKEVESEPQAPSRVLLRDAKPTTADLQESAFVSSIRKRVSLYVDSMSGNVPQNALTGGTHQRALLNTLFAVLGNDDATESRNAMKVVLEMFDQYRGNCFNETLAFRFLNSNSLSQDQSKVLRMLLSVLMTTANPNTRNVTIRNVDWRKLTDQLEDERHRLNLMSFFFPNQ